MTYNRFQPISLDILPCVILYSYKLIKLLRIPMVIIYYKLNRKVVLIYLFVILSIKKHNNNN